MTEPAIFFSDVNERQSVFHRRAFVMGGLAGVGLRRWARGWRTADLREQPLHDLAASNQYNFRLIPPPRGRILDRNGVELASNRPNFRLLVLRDEVKDPDATLDAAAELIPISDDRRASSCARSTQGPRFVPVGDRRRPELGGVRPHQRAQPRAARACRPT